MKARPEGAQLFRVDGQGHGRTDRQTDMTKLTIIFRDFSKMPKIANFRKNLTLNLLTTTIVAPPSNASKWQMGFNSAFKSLTKCSCSRQYILYLKILFYDHYSKIYLLV
jgi:hypothetical protein